PHVVLGPALCLFAYDPVTAEFYTLSLHDALPIFDGRPVLAVKGSWQYRARKFVLRHKIGMAATIVFALALAAGVSAKTMVAAIRSEEHTSELQSLTNIVCRLLLEKKNNIHT